MATSRKLQRVLSSTAKGVRLQVRLSVEQKARLQRAADIQGQTLSNFVLEIALPHAEEVIRKQEVLRLSASDSRAFVEALLDPPPPSARMRVLAARYAREVVEK